jgi:hypothetical protein
MNSINTSIGYYPRLYLARNIISYVLCMDLLEQLTNLSNINLYKEEIYLSQEDPS